MLRLIVTLAAWGFAGIILIGPALAVLAIAVSLIVAVVATIAPFVVLGLFFYLPYRLLFVRDVRWQHVRRAGTACQSAAVPPARWCAGKVRETADWSGRVCSRTASAGWIALETICGALIGSGMGWLLASPLMKKRELVLYVLLACLAGAVLGLLVGLANHVATLRGQTSSS